jgi:hypothetical protein
MAAFGTAVLTAGMFRQPTARFGKRKSIATSSETD